jgi:hypothetical protein
LFIGIVLNAEERLDVAGSGRLRLGKFENRRTVRVGNGPAIAVDEINDGGAGAGGGEERCACDKQRGEEGAVFSYCD